MSSDSVTAYAPQTNVACPDNATAPPLVRTFTPQNQTLHPAEVDFINNKTTGDLANAAWTAWVGNGSALGYNFSAFTELPKIGIGVSGGGERAAQYGAGVLSALDARNASSVAAGTGGLLQVTAYLAGLSGGSWMLGSVYFNNWPTIPDMVLGNGGNMSGWLLDLGLATPNGDDVFDELNQYFFGSLLWSVEAKAYKGIDTSLTDPWARMISYHFLNETSRSNFFTNDSAHGAGQLWSNIPQIPAYQQYLTPFPIVQADSFPIGSNSTAALGPVPIVYEMTPLEFGSWDPNLSAMTNITYIGTHFNNGQPPNSTACVTGFDQVGFIMATSASLFNQIVDAATNKLSGFSGEDGAGLAYLLSRQIQELRTRSNDFANWPNPFQSISPLTFEDSNSTWLNLIDGSSNLENIPLGPLFVKARGLDVVVAVDSSADQSGISWPNGSSLVFSQSRITTILKTSHQGFPPIPSDPAHFISTGVNQRPTFFGCNPTQSPPEWPLLIYLPNSPPINGDNPVTNTGTFKISYTQEHTKIFLDQVHANTISGFTPNSTHPDAQWGHCLQCAVLDRARLKTSPTPARSTVCSACFQQYCYDPQNPPSSAEIVGRRYKFVDPDPQDLSAVESFISNKKVPLIIGLVLLVLLIIGAIFGLRWWKKRKDREYKRLTTQYEDAPWKMYGDRLTSIELSSSHRESHISE